jgi:hypothetical protein
MFQPFQRFNRFAPFKLYPEILTVRDSLRLPAKTSIYKIHDRGPK